MSDVGDCILNVVMALVALWIVHRFWGSFFDRKQNSILLFGTNLLYCIFQFIRQFSRGNINVLMTVVNILLILSLAICGYNCAGKKKYFLLLLLFSVWSLLEEFIFFLFKNIQSQYWDQDEIGAIISNILMTILVYILSTVWNNRNIEFIPNKYYLLMLLIPVGTIYIAISEFYSYGSGSKIHSMITVSILILFNVIIFDIYIRMNKGYEYEKERTVYAQQFDMISYSTLEQKKIMEEFYEEKHNLINELIVLKNEIELGDKVSAIQNLNKIIHNCHYAEIVSNSGNSIIDAIINFKYAIASEYGIEFHLKVFIPDELPIEPSDIGVVLGNAIDNAIEAVKICKRKRFIEISMSVKKEAWILVIKNPYEHELKKDRAGALVSTKEEKNRHGYGLKSIMRIAEEYQGDAIIDTSDGIFSLTVVLNLKEF